MPELSRSSKYLSTPDAPLGDDERNRLTSRLNDAYAAGAVSGDAYRAHLDTLFAATRLGDVAPVVADLPAVATHDTPAIVGQGPGEPGELAPASPRPWPVVLGVLLGATAVAVIVVIALIVALVVR